MNFVKLALLPFMLLILGLPQLSLAVTPTAVSGIGVLLHGEDSEVVARGGMINSVNWERQKISVDGKNYTLSSSLKVYDAAGLSADRSGLQRGSLIRFNTVKSGNQFEVIEIWMVKPRTGTPQR